MSATQSGVSRELRVFTGLRVEDFQHPEDRNATEQLRRLTGFETICTKLIEYGIERTLYLQNLSCNVRVSEKMFPRLNKALNWACGILDVPPPELYICTDPQPNAMTMGHTKPFIIINTGLLDLLSDQELFAVLAHELGHIKAGHVLYMTMANYIGVVAEVIGQVTLGLGTLAGQGIQLALLHWARRAELTADRAALLAVQNIDTCTRLFMKLAAGTQKRVAEMDESEFMKQIIDFNSTESSAMNKIYKVLLTMNMNHPPTILRAHELEKWSRDGYRRFVPIQSFDSGTSAS